MDRTKYTFTTTWFENTTKGSWDTYIPQMDPQRYLEIGSYEGASTTFVIDAIKDKHPIEVHAIDTWEGGIEHKQTNMSEVEKTFDNNIEIAKSEYSENITFIKHKGFSDECMIDLYNKGYKNYFDLIYIDGSHMAVDILSDAILAFKLLKVGGYIIFDDYQWFMTLQNSNDVILPSFSKIAIDSFINIYFSKVRLVAPVAEQVIIRKIDN